ncbi:GUN4 domain-containing protein [Nostoc sp. LPT]|uniref:GUN4 domain-containing protein n=1 Tax=Nostoc sp. LPT TaxID=2815387 RepID=UPI001DD3AFE9|nr:GUN4 domain-containing protein [Nostoc sp. LPT]MBN4005240.1 GUN4 domain-containing protein [Nostoc sp. LPT]
MKKKRIRLGVVVLLLTVIGTIFLGALTKSPFEEMGTEVKAVQLLSKNNTESELRKQVKKPLTEDLYVQLENSLKSQNWLAANTQTSQLMLNIAKKEKEQYLTPDDINSFSCRDLQRLDRLWVANSHNRFGFSVQKEIWIKQGNPLDIKANPAIVESRENDYKTYLRFAKSVGWASVKDNETTRGEYIGIDDLTSRIKNDPNLRGSLPVFDTDRIAYTFWRGWIRWTYRLLLRSRECGL